MIAGDWIKNLWCPNAVDLGCGDESLVYTEYGDSQSDQSSLGAECDWCELELNPKQLKELLEEVDE